MLTYAGTDVNTIRYQAQQRLLGQQTRVAKFVAYYDGNFPLGRTVIKDSSDDMRDIFRRLLQESVTNWSELVVNAVAERLHVEGFRFGDDATDDLAWRIWQASSMDADAEMGQTDALVCGSTFCSIVPDEDNPTGVSLYLEHPTQTTVLYKPGHRRHRRAAYKMFVNEDTGLPVETLVLPGVTLTWTDNRGRDDYPNTAVENTTDIIPVVEVASAPRTLGYPRSELESVIPIQNRIHTTIYNRLEATDFAAFRQITATGIKLPRDPKGKPRAPFNVGADRLLTSENPEARIGVIPESNGTWYLNGVEADVKHMAAITQTPPHYLLGQMINIPASGMKAAETGLVAKTRRRAAHLGEGWEEVQRTGLAMVGRPQTNNLGVETIWRDFESRSEGETVDALVKMRTLDVPLEVLWQRWGATPPEINRWKEMRSTEQVATATAAALTFGATDPYSQLMNATREAAS